MIIFNVGTCFNGLSERASKSECKRTTTTKPLGDFADYLVVKELLLMQGMWVGSLVWETVIPHVCRATEPAHFIAQGP